MNWLPTNGNGTWRHLILPSFTVALSYISTYIRLIRNNMLENMKQDYVLYANVRGLPQKSILVKHILKNSMHTCIVAMGMSIPQLISGMNLPTRSGSVSRAENAGIIGILESTLVFQVRPNPLTPNIASAQVCDGMAFSEQIPEHVGAYSCEDAVRRFRIRVSHPVETAQTISYHPNFMPVNRVNHRTGRHTVLRMACGLFVYPVHFVIMPDGRSEASCRRGCIGIFWKTVSSLRTQVLSSR